MNLTQWSGPGVIGFAAILAAGCAQPSANNASMPNGAFTIQDIKTMPGRRDGRVQIKLSTPGNYAEADESTLVRIAQIVAVREASSRQRQVAEERARATYRKIAAQPASHPKKSRYLAVKTDLSAPTPQKAGAEGSRSKPKARATASVMIFDTETQEIVGNKVYDLGSAPPSGSVARFETFTAEYVGSGL